ncbi:MAG: heparinase II/III family protein [Acidimicrobiales bacterium]
MDPPARHQRTVTLDCSARSLDIVDHVASIGSHHVRLAFHLGPSVRSIVDGNEATLRWVRSPGDEATATLTLPGQLAWSTYWGSTDPVLGWYSPSFGRRQPTTTLVGAGLATDSLFHSRLQFTS